MFYIYIVIYSVNNITYIGNQYYKLGDIFRFTEPSSGQYLKQSNGTFRAFIVLITNMCCVID